jgi:putative peptide zinc metalloprotease protein
MTQVATNRYAALSLVRDGDGYVIGSRHSRTFVAVPEIGGTVVGWLQDGHTVAECADRAAKLMGEPVNVADFVEGLTAAGLLPPDDGGLPDVGPANADPANAGPADAGPSAWTRRVGKILFGRAGLIVQSALAIGGLGALVAVPDARPHYTDVIVSQVALLSMVVVAVLATVSGLVHECAHVLAAAARGVPSRVSISRRMITIVYQTDLTRLWGVSRRQRVVPLVAGPLSDAATLGLLLTAEAALSPGLPLSLVRALVFIKVSGIAFQFEVFMRTDFYALFVVATGCRNLWGTKGAVARRAIRRATAEDLDLLASVHPREIRWARLYLFLYVPGVAWTMWYFITFALPATIRLASMSVGAIASHGVVSLLGAAGLLALAITATTTVFILRGLLRTITRLVRTIAAR